MSQYFLNERDTRGIVTITLNRPDMHNAFNEDFIAELIKGFEDINIDESIRLVVITGAGKSFCAGADLNWMKKMKDYSDAENYQDSLTLRKLFETINSCPHPVLAKCNGAALGGGTGILAVCDYVMACQSAKMGFTEVCLGLVPAVISPFVMAKIGFSNARAYFLSGERFDATHAKELGLVHKVVTLDDLDTQFDKTLERFLRAAPMAARAAKKLAFGVDHKIGETKEGVYAIEDFTCQMIASIRTGPEAQEGMGALLDKRKPNWIKE